MLSDFNIAAQIDFVHFLFKAKFCKKYLKNWMFLAQKTGWLGPGSSRSLHGFIAGGMLLFTLQIMAAPSVCACEWIWIVVDHGCGYEIHSALAQILRGCIPNPTVCPSQNSSPCLLPSPLSPEPSPQTWGKKWRMVITIFQMHSSS